MWVRGRGPRGMEGAADGVPPGRCATSKGRASCLREAGFGTSFSRPVCGRRPARSVRAFGRVAGLCAGRRRPAGSASRGSIGKDGFSQDRAGRQTVAGRGCAEVHPIALPFACRGCGRCGSSEPDESKGSNGERLTAGMRRAGSEALVCAVAGRGAGAENVGCGSRMAGGEWLVPGAENAGRGCRMPGAWNLEPGTGGGQGAYSSERSSMEAPDQGLIA